MVSKTLGFVKGLVAPAAPPFWLKIDHAIDREDAIIQTAFENTRSISQDELRQIMDIREERNGFVFRKFLSGVDPRRRPGRSVLPREQGGGDYSMPLDEVKEEIARRVKYRAGQTAVPGSRNLENQKAEINFENRDLNKVIRYWAKTKYTATEKAYNANYIAGRHGRVIGMDIWNALLLHDTLTASCFERMAGTQSMSRSERDKIQENVDDLKFLVRIRSMDQ
ncbi:hypothetical protein T484DRAFT_1757711 [Baffinella frigidus]|nr:hypothetical protein T484DRAFT_1757711 [Cryptophyta sp. CCMP2293]